jgi:MFS family permease
MSNRMFIYYCVVWGGGAAFLAGAIMVGIGSATLESDLLHSLLVGALLGTTVAGALASVDAYLNASSGQRLGRILGAAGCGFVMGLFAGMLCELLIKIAPWFRFIGWIVLGVVVGAACNLYDLAQSYLTGKPLGLTRSKLSRAIIGGALGGALGGLLFSLLDLTRVHGSLPRTSLVSALVMLGMGIGLFAGFGHLILKEAWIKVEAGFRPGREVRLDKWETTIGRAEACDLGLFGDNSIDSIHARIERREQWYFLADADSAGGTFLNNRRVLQPTRLHSGDLIRVGSSVIMFGERAKA